MKFKVFYNQEKDIDNYLKSSWKFEYLRHGRKNIQNMLLSNYPEWFKNELKKTKTKKEARKVVITFLESLPKSFHNTTSLIARGVESLLNENSKNIEAILSEKYGKKVPFNKINVYLTTCNIYPYNHKEGWYMSGRNESEQGHIKTALHELNHFMFYYYYSYLLKELDDKKFEVFKEALAIFTNPEGTDKPDVKKLEAYFKDNIKHSIDQLIKNGVWRKFI